MDNPNLRQRVHTQLTQDEPYLNEKQRSPTVESKRMKQTWWRANQDWAVPAILLVISLIRTWWRIHDAKFVVWDEAHFGKFGSYYITGKFYFDVHPPLGKIIVGIAGFLSGYDGSFEFKSGDPYPDTLNFVIWRLILSFFGAAMVPIAYLTARELRFSTPVSLMTAAAVLFDNAFLSISRYILLDSLLLFFTTTTVYTLTAFRNQRTDAFSVEWWTWLILTGLSIGLVSSVKWVGFFVTALVGLYTIGDLWNLLGDVHMPKVTYARHLVSRIACLIVFPILVYIFSFWLHFAILQNSGPGDAQMSSLFQASLQGNTFHTNPLEVAYESKITLKNMGYGGGLLHSHIQRYPEGSEQQQVTCYHHKDSNNEWIVKKPRGEETSEDPPQLLKDGEIIRLVHAGTGRNLHSHPVKAPVSVAENEVSCYGNETIGDSNDHWRVEIHSDMLGGKIDTVKSLTTRMRFVHVNSGCLLRSHNVILPQWGFKQAETLCDKQKRQDYHNLWNVEQHVNEKLPAGDAKTYKSRFLADFWHLNVAMYTSNNALVPDPTKEPDQLTSNPSEWPLLIKGLRMCGWGDDVFKVYLIGNPFVWWLGAAALLCIVGLLGIHMLLEQRRIYAWNNPEHKDNFMFAAYVAVGGWLLHFLPFGLMGRVTYLHHYFPALYFAIFALALVVQYIGGLIPIRSTRTVFSVLLMLIIGATFFYFAPLSYGFWGPHTQYADRKWLSTWTMTN